MILSLNKNGALLADKDKVTRLQLTMYSFNHGFNVVLLQFMIVKVLLIQKLISLLY